MAVISTDETAFMNSHRWTWMMCDKTSAAFYRRWSRATEILVNQQPDGSFTVPSSRDPNTTYTVSLSSGCDCPDTKISWQYAAPYGWCKHRLAVWMYVHSSEHDHPESLADFHHQQIAERSNHLNPKYTTLRRRAS